eukprot:PhM_4_TR17010/c0_g1_i2/m.96774/K11229/BCK1; mitogen-activated protein kinase kinase kinase
MESLTNYTTAEVVGGSFLSMLPGQQQDEVRKVVSAITEGNLSRSPSMALSLMTHVTSERVVAFHAAAAFNGSGEVTGVIFAGSTHVSHHSTIVDKLRAVVDEGGSDESSGVLAAIKNIFAEAQESGVDEYRTPVSIGASIGTVVDELAAEARQRLVAVDVRVRRSVPRSVFVNSSTVHDVLHVCLEHVVKVAAKEMPLTVTARRQRGNVVIEIVSPAVPSISSAGCHQMQIVGSRLGPHAVDVSEMTVTIIIPISGMRARFDDRDIEPVPDPMRIALHTSAVNSGLVVNTLWKQGHVLRVLKTWEQIHYISDKEGIEVVLLDETGPATTRHDPSRVADIVEEFPAVLIIHNPRDAVRTQQLQLTKAHLIPIPLRVDSLVNALAKVSTVVGAHRTDREFIARARQLFAETKQCSWERGALLGCGAMGEVYLATNTLTGGRMAAKMIRLPTDEEKLQDLVVVLLSEIEVMTKLEHTNIVHYLYCERSDAAVYLFMEYCAGGSLLDRLKRQGPLSIFEAAQCLRDILNGLAYLHANNIVHRDLKAANVLLTEHGTCKLADFGTAVALSNGNVITGTTHGTLCFMAPEVLNDSGHDWHCDIWSLGCLLMELVTGHRPFYHVGHNHPAEVLNYVSHLTPDDTVNLDVFEDEKLVSFLGACLAVNPLLRPSCETLLVHPLMTANSQALADVEAAFGTGKSTGQDSAPMQEASHRSTLSSF